MSSMTKTNLITALTAAVHTDAAPQLYCTIINVLTGMTCSQTMKHIGMVLRHEIPSGLDYSDLDLRNEQDEAARGVEVGDIMTAMSGFNVKDTPKYAAQVMDAIRYSLYEEMHAWGEYNDPEHLVREAKVQSITARRNYTQPMSAEMYMDFRITNADKINPNEVTLAATRLKLPEAIIRQALTDEAIKNKRMLEEMKPTVLAEVGSYEDVYDDDRFTTLDMELQCMFAEKLSTKLDQQYMRMLPRAIRSLDAASELEVIRRQHEIVKEWLIDNDAELQEAMLRRKAA